jgi:hypothetical protein
MASPSHPHVLSIAESRPVSEIAVGFFDTYGGGFLARFTLMNGESRLLAFSASHAFDLRDQFSDSLDHFEKHGFVRDPVQRVQPLPSEDFHRQGIEEVGAWFLDACADGALWRLTIRRGTDAVIRLSPSQMASLLFEVECGIEHVVVIDLRPYHEMGWIQLGRVLEDHPGFKLAGRLRAFDFSLEIFRRNARALVQHLGRATGPLNDEQVRWDRRFEIDSFINDAIHLLLNFVASACALVDHSRTFYQYHYKPRGELAHYHTELRTRFAADGTVQFIHKLRVLMLHVGLVGLVHRTSFRPDGFVGRVTMDRDAALVWDGWESVATKWLKEGPRHLDLLETVNAYMSKAEEFQTWYARERERIDWHDLRYAEQLRRAVLARRGLEEIPKLRALLDLPATALDRMRLEVGQFLNAEQMFNLRHDEDHPERWLPKALDIIRNSYFVPTDLADALIQHFTVSTQRELTRRADL